MSKKQYLKRKVEECVKDFTNTLLESLTSTENEVNEQSNNYSEAEAHCSKQAILIPVSTYKNYRSRPKLFAFWYRRFHSVPFGD